VNKALDPHPLFIGHLASNSTPFLFPSTALRGRDATSGHRTDPSASALRVVDHHQTAAAAAAAAAATASSSFRR
jgi:hypothetical protein